MTTYTQKAYKPDTLEIKRFEIGSSLFTAGEAVELYVVAENTAKVRLISYGLKIGYWQKRTFVPILDFGKEDCYWEDGKDCTIEAVATASGERFDAIHNAMLESGERAQNGFTAQFTLGTAAGEELIEYYPMSKDIYLLDRKYAPAIAEDFEIVRCSADGRPSMTGEHVSITAKISPDAPPEGFDCRLDYGRAGVAFEQSSDLQEDIGKLIAGIDHDADLISLLFDRYTAYDFMLYYGDQYENVSAKCTIPGVLDHLGLDNAGNIHVTGEVSAAMESDIPAYFHGGIANIQTGTVMATTKTPSNNCSDHPILFEKPFAAGTVPTVIVGLVSSSTAARFGVCTCAVLDGSVTNEGFTIRFYNSDVSSRLPGFSYIAFGEAQKPDGGNQS